MNEYPDLADPCVICNEVVKTSFGEPYRTAIIKNNMCFNCTCWLEVLDEQRHPSTKRVIIDHRAYWIGPEARNSTIMRGYGGRKFTIKLNSGEVIETTNLWDNGNIPEYFWHMLPDNAEFIK